MESIDTTRQPSPVNRVADDEDEWDTVLLTEDNRLGLGPWWGGGLSALATSHQKEGSS